MSDTGLKPKARVDGRHELVERLDDRGAGEAWKARDPDFKTRLALLKVLGPLPTGASSAPAALVDLARRLRTVRHPCMLPVTGVGAHEGRAYVALAWFEGISLAAALREGEPSALDALAKTFDALCEAVAACHAAGIVHGGVTPGCVLAQRGTGGELEVRLADVGLAPFADQGTAFLYEDCVAPEGRGGMAPGPSMDVFGLGATLRRALAAPADATAWAEPRAGFRGREDVPKAVWDVVERATSADASARYESAEALRAALGAAWGDDARLPVRRAQEPTEAPRAQPGDHAAPRMLWDAPVAPPPPREPTLDEQRTTFKLPSLDGVSAGPPASSPLSLDTLLGQEPSTRSESTPPAHPEPAPVPRGANNPWSTDVLRQEVRVTPPVPTGANNPWSTDVLRREVQVEDPAARRDVEATQVDFPRRTPVAVGAPAAAPLTLDGLVGSETAVSGTVAWGAPPEAPEPKIARTEMANPELLQAALARTKAAQAQSAVASPSRSRVWVAVAVALVLLVGAVVAAFAAGVF